MPVSYSEEVARIAAMEEVSYDAVVSHAIAVYVWLRQEADTGKRLVFEDACQNVIEEAVLGDVSQWDRRFRQR